MESKNTYAHLATMYDLLFFALGKNYEAESHKVSELIEQYVPSHA